MSLTVRKLISLLKKMPPTAVVAWRDHDQSEDEINGWARCVEEADEALYASRAEQADWIPAGKKIVVISP